ncbi:hypothetical protein ACFL28_01345 [Candidatus Omnitrophota bacterium]
MTKFESLFGIKESLVKNTCILMPLLKKDILEWLGVKNFSRGRLHGSGNSRLFTVIHTGLGPALLGDAVLYLKETNCQNIILFGSCGLVKEESHLGIGSLVVPSKCYCLEGFTEMLLKDKNNYGAFYPDNALIENFLTIKKACDIKKVTCITLGSLKLEEDYIDTFKEKEIQVVDMECSALFSASKYIKRASMAFLYVTDIINKKPFYMDLKREDRLTLSSSIKASTHILCKFIEENLSS